MALPLRRDITSSAELSDDQLLQAVIRSELQLLTDEYPTLEKYRDWYEGDQTLTFGTTKFQQTFGSTFQGFRDNWCGVVVDAVLDKLELLGLDLVGNDTNSELAESLWTIFRANDIDEMQEEVHQGTLVEGRGAVIVWPDPELGARIDWNPAQLVRVRYSDDDPRKPVFAVKRWVTPSGQIRVTVYTENFVYKYFDTANLATIDATTHGVATRVPATAPSFGLTPRETRNEPWPLPNPMRIVPVVEFINRKGSEIRDVIPQQDAINYLLTGAMVASEYSTIPPRILFSGASEPEGGWNINPGIVWRIPPVLDADGKPIPSSIDQFRPGNLDQYRNLVDAFLMHIALTSKTPVRYFFQSDRGGRGDAPSGESLLVEDQPLIDKVERKQTRYGNSWYRVTQLVAKAISGPNTNIPFGEVRWKDPRAQYRSALLDEALKMLELGIPFNFTIRKLGLTPEEISEIERVKDEQPDMVNSAANGVDEPATPPPAT